MDFCNTTTKDRSTLRVCELPLRHDGDHRDGDFVWPATDVRRDPADRIIEV